MWEKQKGLCALTQLELDSSAQLDHIIPRISGGTDDIENLRWVAPFVNVMKGGFGDKEFATNILLLLPWATSTL